MDQKVQEHRRETSKDTHEKRQEKQLPALLTDKLGPYLLDSHHNKAKLNKKAVPTKARLISNDVKNYMSESPESSDAYWLILSSGSVPAS